MTIGHSALTRRNLLGAGAGLGVAAWLGLGGARAGELAKGDFPVEMAPAAWKKKLSAQEYRILREAGTERPYSSPLLKVKAPGTFRCAGCDNPLYRTKTKYDSGTGWPSFWAPISADAVGYMKDRSLMMVRTEVHCARCGGHLGHVFDDGPPPTGKRHCINGAALDFAKGEAA